MIVGIPKETAADETRVAAVPDLVAKYVQTGLSVQVESGAGARAHVLDDAYAKAGATIVADRNALLQTADIVLKVQSPDNAEVASMKPGGMLNGAFAPSRNLELVNALNAQQITTSH